MKTRARLLDSVAIPAHCLPDTQPEIAGKIMITPGHGPYYALYPHQSSLIILLRDPAQRAAIFGEYHTAGVEYTIRKGEWL